MYLSSRLEDEQKSCTKFGYLFFSNSLMKRNGATIIAQDEASCVVYGMPKEPAEASIVDIVKPLDKIAAAITGTVQNR